MRPPRRRRTAGRWKRVITGASEIGKRPGGGQKAAILRTTPRPSNGQALLPAPFPLKDRRGCCAPAGARGRLVGAFTACSVPLPLERSHGLSRTVPAVGPRTGIHTKLLRNLAILHPDAPMAELRSAPRMSFGWLGEASPRSLSSTDPRAMAEMWSS